MKKSGGFEMDQMGYLILSLLVIIAVFGLYIVLSGKGNVALEAFKNFWRFGR